MTVRDRIEHIKRHLADGETYQVNYTFRIAGSFWNTHGEIADATTANIVDELRTASRIWLMNSVHEWWPAVLS